jgi:hypothetical protein
MHHAMILRRLLAVVVLVGATGAAAVTDVVDVAPLRLQGLDPGQYLQRRHRTPELSAELRALPTETLLAILKDEVAIAWADEDAYGAMKPAERATWRAKERRALKQGALAVLQARDDAGIADAFLAVLDDVDLKVAAAAAERLGAKPGREALLARIAGDTARALEVRAGACAGLGAQRSKPAVDALVAVVAGAGDEALALSALTALEQATSRWAFEARGDVATGAALRARAADALEGLALRGEVATRRDVVVKRLR